MEIGYDSDEDLLKRDGHFLRISEIRRYVSFDQCFLRGWRLKRTRHLGGLLPHDLNEVCVVVNLDEGDHRGVWRAGLQDIPASLAFKKRKLVMTNQLFPALSFRKHTGLDSQGEHAKEHTFDIACSSELVCRYVSISYLNRRTRKPINNILRRLSEEEADEGATLPDAFIRKEWLQRHPKPGSAYTFGDCFSGCGGVSKGAQMVDLNVRFAFDRDTDASDSYEANFEDSDIWVLDVHNFRAIADDDFVVDIIHFSPPCQFLSPANYQAGYRDPTTAAGRNDDANEAAMFCITDIVKKTRPRVATVEQTFGIEHHEGHLRGLVNQFTSLGYSCRWRILNFADYGLPQQRRRFILIASCPAGVLPNFPRKTHGPTHSSLQRYATVNDCILGIPSNHPNHEPKYFPQRRGASDGNRQLRQLISTGGAAGDYHPSGRRHFTVRELASLQTFPLDFQFPLHQRITTVRRQIGNAVPPLFAKALLAEIKTALLREDETWAREAGL